MARRRVRASRRREEDREAYNVGSAVYTIARDLRGHELPLPIFVTAPLVYISEMMGSVLCKRRGWEDRARVDQVARYLMAGLQEYAVALFEGFDEEHFEAWRGAAEGRDG